MHHGDVEPLHLGRSGKCAIRRGRRGRREGRGSSSVRADKEEEEGDVARGAVAVSRYYGADNTRRINTQYNIIRIIPYTTQLGSGCIV